MIDPVTKGPHTYHTTNPVPLILVNESPATLRQGGALQDIAPTLLGVLGESQPKEMTGRDLRVKYHSCLPDVAQNLEPAPCTGAPHSEFVPGVSGPQVSL